MTDFETFKMYLWITGDIVVIGVLIYNLLK